MPKGPCGHVIFPLCKCAPVAPVEPQPPIQVLVEDPEADQELLARLQQVEALRKKIRRRRMRESLAEFFKAAWAHMKPGTTLEWGPHIQAVCDHIQWQLEDSARAKADPSFKMRAQNMLINVPPRSLKTSVLTYATVWAWLRWPDLRIMYLSANPRVAWNSARDARDLIISHWFQTTFEPEWKIRTDQNALTDLGNTAGGARISRGLDGAVTGEGCVTGDTLVSTEWGDIPIIALDAMEPKPRVWSKNIETGELELRKIVDWKLSGFKKTVEVRTLSGNVLRLTDDHNIWTTDGYIEAAASAGRAVSVLSGTQPPGEPRPSSAVPKLRRRDAGVSGVQPELRQGRRGAREGATSLPWSRTDVLPKVQLHPEQEAGQGEHRASAHPRMLAMQAGLRPQVQGPIQTMVFAGLSRDVPEAVQATTNPGGHPVRALPHAVPTVLDADCVLLEEVQERGAQPGNARLWQLELQRQAEALLRGALGQPGAADSRAGWASMYGVSAHRAPEEDPRASHRSRPEEQRAGEPDRALFGVSYEAPQVQARPGTVVSVDARPDSGCDQEVPVYDITVEGNHNFFANGILVHNSAWQIVDDPHDLRDSIESIEKVIEGYDSAVGNRINDPRTSIRTCIMQRVNIMDFAAHVLKQKWLHIRIPMEYESKPTCTCDTCLAGVNAFGWKDWRTVEGEVLHPRFTPDFLAGERIRLMEFGYASQMQQRPSVLGGGRIKKDYWGFFRLSDHHAGDHPRPAGCKEDQARIVERIKSGWNRGKYDLDWTVITVDAANKKTDRGSAYGMLAVSGKDMRRFVLDDRTRRGEFTEILDVLRDMIVTWRPDKVIVEAKAAGPSLMSSLETEMAEGKLRAHDLDAQGSDTGCRGLVVSETTNTTQLWRCKRCGEETSGNPIICAIEGIEVDIDKERRVDAVLPQIAARMVYLLEGAGWLDAFVEEHALFPESPWNDRVDALSQALEAYKDGPFYVL